LDPSPTLAGGATGAGAGVLAEVSCGFGAEGFGCVRLGGFPTLGAGAEPAAGPLGVAGAGAGSE
jgi:hypothetical protein